MTKFTCVSLAASSPLRTVERDASTHEKAADACAAAVNKAYWADYWREGTDVHGNYREFKIQITATRLHGTVRVYEKYNADSYAQIKANRAKREREHSCAVGSNRFVCSPTRLCRTCSE